MILEAKPMGSRAVGERRSLVGVRVYAPQACRPQAVGPTGNPRAPLDFCRRARLRAASLPTASGRAYNPYAERRL